MQFVEARKKPTLDVRPEDGPLSVSVRANIRTGRMCAFVAPSGHTDSRLNPLCVTAAGKPPSLLTIWVISAAT